MAEQDSGPFNVGKRIKQALLGADIEHNLPHLGHDSIYGFSMGFTKKGKPVFEEFGNTSAFGSNGFIEPISDVIEKHDMVSVLI